MDSSVVIPELDQKIDKCCFVMAKDLSIVKSDNAFCRFFNSSSVKNLCEYIKDNGEIELKTLLSTSIQEGKTATYACRLVARGKIRLCLLYMTRKADDNFNVILYDTVCLRDMIDMLSSNDKRNSAILAILHVVYFLYDTQSSSVFINNTQNMGNPIVLPLEDICENLAFCVEQKGITGFNTIQSSEFETLLLDLRDLHTDKSYTFTTHNEDKVTLITKCLSKDFMHENQVLGVFGFSNHAVEVSLSKEVNIDGLTGVLNKKAILEYARHTIDTEHKNVTLMIMDLDDFKQINDTYGHAFGDDVIVKFAGVLTSSIAVKGKVGRFGGDEFFCVMTGVDDIATIREIARNIRLGIQWAYISEMPDLILTCSIGIVRYPLDAKNFNDAFSLADNMLYLAKAKGKNRYIYYNPELHSGLDLKKIATDKVLTADSMTRFYLEEQIQMLERLFIRKKGFFASVMQSLCKLLALKQASLYVFDENSNAHLEYTTGEETLDTRKDSINEKYIALFDKSEAFINDNVTMFEAVKKWLFEMYISHKTMSSFEFLIRKEDKPAFLLCFDRGYPSRKWTEQEQRMLFIVCAQIKKYGYLDKKSKVTTS